MFARSLSLIPVSSLLSRFALLLYGSISLSASSLHDPPPPPIPFSIPLLFPSLSLCFSLSVTVGYRSAGRLGWLVSRLSLSLGGMQSHSGAHWPAQSPHNTGAPLTARLCLCVRWCRWKKHTQTHPRREKKAVGQSSFEKVSQHAGHEQKH